MQENEIKSASDYPLARRPDRRTSYPRNANAPRVPRIGLLPWENRRRRARPYRHYTVRTFTIYVHEHLHTIRVAGGLRAQTMYLKKQRTAVVIITTVAPPRRAEIRILWRARTTGRAARGHTWGDRGRRRIISVSGRSAAVDPMGGGYWGDYPLPLCVSLWKTCSNRQSGNLLGFNDWATRKL